PYRGCQRYSTTTKPNRYAESRLIPRSHQDPVLGSRRICGVEQAPGGGHVRAAVRRGRGATARDHGARAGSVAERHRPDASGTTKALPSIRVEHRTAFLFSLGRAIVSEYTVTYSWRSPPNISRKIPRSCSRWCWT